MLINPRLRINAGCRHIMFSSTTSKSLVAVFIAALASAVLARPQETPSPTTTCQTGSLQCCGAIQVLLNLSCYYRIPDRLFFLLREAQMRRLRLASDGMFRGIVIINRSSEIRARAVLQSTSTSEEIKTRVTARWHAAWTLSVWFLQLTAPRMRLTCRRDARGQLYAH